MTTLTEVIKITRGHLDTNKARVEENQKLHDVTIHENRKIELQGILLAERQTVKELHQILDTLMLFKSSLVGVF